MGDSILGTPEHPPVVAQLGAALEQHDAVCAIAVRELAVSSPVWRRFVAARLKSAS